MTRTPKEAFLAMQNVRQEHEQIVATTTFHTACDYALLEFVNEIGVPTDPSKGWDSTSQMVGAKKVLEILKSLHEPIAVQKSPEFDTLNYNT